MFGVVGPRRGARGVAARPRETRVFWVLRRFRRSIVARRQAPKPLAICVVERGRAATPRAPDGAYVRARRNSDVPIPKKMTFAVHAATNAGRRSARANASAT